MTVQFVHESNKDLILYFLYNIAFEIYIFVTDVRDIPTG